MKLTRAGRVSRLGGLRLRGSITLVLVATLALAGCGGSRTATAGDEVTLRLATTTGPGTPTDVALKAFIDDVKNKSDGHIKINYFPNSQLGDEATMQTDLTQGTLDIASFDSASYAGTYPKLNVFSLPGLIPDASAMKSLALSNFTFNLLDNLSPDFTGIGFFSNGSVSIVSNKPIKTAADLSGVKLRSYTDPISTNFWGNVGANVVPMNFAEVYSALQNHAIDAVATSTSGVTAGKLSEVTKYLTLPNQQWNTSIVIASTVSMKRLPQSYQDLLKQAGKDATKVELDEMNKQNAAAISDLQKAGMTVEQSDEDSYKAVAGATVTKFSNQIGADVISGAQAAAQGKSDS